MDSNLKHELQKRGGYWPSIVVMAAVGWLLGFILWAFINWITGGFGDGSGLSWIFCSWAVAVIVAYLAYVDGVSRGAELVYQMQSENKPDGS